MTPKTTGFYSGAQISTQWPRTYLFVLCIIYNLCTPLCFYYNCYVFVPKDKGKPICFCPPCVHLALSWSDFTVCKPNGLI